MWLSVSQTNRRWIARGDHYWPYYRLSAYLVARERIKILDVRISTVARVVTQWGVGAQELLHKENPPK